MARTLPFPFYFFEGLDLYESLQVLRALLLAVPLSTCGTCLLGRHFQHGVYMEMYWPGEEEFWFGLFSFLFFKEKRSNESCRKEHNLLLVSL